MSPLARGSTCFVLATVAMVAAGAPATPAAPRQLDLAPMARFPPVGSPHPADATLAAIDLELSRLRLARSAATGAKLDVVDAFIATREIAQALLRASVRSSGEAPRAPDGAASTAAPRGAERRSVDPRDRDSLAATAAALGFRLADAREPIDATLRAALARDDAAYAPVGALLRGFASEAPRAVAAIGATGDADVLRTATAHAVRPLERAAAIILDTTPVNPWPIVGPSNAGGSATGGASAATGTALVVIAPAPSVEAMRDRLARLDAAALSDSARAATMRVIAPPATQPGGAVGGTGAPVAQTAGDADADDARLRRNDQRRAAASGLLDLAEAAAAAEYLNDDQRSRIDDRIAHIATGLADDATVGEAALRAGEAAESARVLAATTALRPALGEQARLLAPLAGLLDKLDEQVAPTATPPPRLAKRAIVAALERIAEQRRLEVKAQGPELVEARRALLVQYRQTEASLLASLSRLAESMGIDADPDLVSLLREHRQLVDDLRRIGQIPAWTARLSAASPASADGVKRQIMKLVRWLVDPNRRPDAAQAVAQLERQAEMFTALPAEDRLRSGALNARLGGPPAVPTDGPGRGAIGEPSATLIDAIDRARSAWTESWSRGDGGGAAVTRMLALARVMRMIDAIDAIDSVDSVDTLDAHDAIEGLDTQLNAARRASIGAALERWPGWSVPIRAVAECARDAEDALRGLVATIAAGGPKDDDLRSLERRLALPRLAVVCADRVGPALDAAPRGSLAALSGLAETPTSDAWPRDAGPMFDRLGLSARAWLAAPAGDPRRATLRAAIDAAVDRMLRDLGEWRGPAPTLRGWDGSDPEGRK